MDKDKAQSALVVAEQQGLVITNPNVRWIARRLRWKPETTIARIQTALPAVVEQQVYLAIARDFKILPESMAKLLRLYLGHEELQAEDLAPVTVGKNLEYSKFNSFSEFLRECLNLLKIVTQEYFDLSLNIEHAGFIVLHYGTEDPERLIEMVDNNLEALCDAIGMGNRKSYTQRMRLCLWVMVSKVIPQNRRNGVPDILDPSDFIQMPSEQRRALRLAISEEIPDYLAADNDELRGLAGFELLKQEGII